MRRVLVVLAIASLAGCRENALLEDGSTGPLPEHASTGSRPLLFVDDTIHFSQIDEYSEDLQWRQVLDTLQSSGSFDFDPARAIYDVEAIRHEPPPPELLFQYATDRQPVRRGKSRTQTTRGHFVGSNRRG